MFSTFTDAELFSALEAAHARKLPRFHARLIAAAPDLLAALKNALNVMAGLATGDLKAITKDSPSIKEARAAIHKATHES